MEEEEDFLVPYPLITHTSLENKVKSNVLNFISIISLFNHAPETYVTESQDTGTLTL